ncbi:tetratricopeptide repeat protein [Tropicimonas sp. IMCC6043]|uniref:tetratricopeptide repeat protein n=1 Tax=Tropicimonas sp. IMCC6043 TaxID=2510645 RepID=UPI00101DF628|nr:tetratricopeptide repeat protein [Tropicimonas sp. IMCC6043]RYH07005.1 tetratricopeptide repeat protein [Tropicimonas sp. IMCC6043]
MTHFDLGTYARAITTSSPNAQKAFSQGLVWLYGYNHEEAAACFERAIANDPGCGMAHWGVAYAIGPNYNKPWEFFDADERATTLERAHKAISDARALKDSLTPVENALIEALADRFPTDPEIEDYGPWNDDFSAAMEKVYAAFPNDLDVVTIYAEAHMNRTPWLLWDLKTGKPAESATTERAKAALEKAFDQQPEAWEHPGLLHMYIHLMEMSPTPEAALRHGDRLADLVPDSGHLVHMATHIDVLCGDYHNVVYRNRRAAAVDRKFEAFAGAQNFYTIYRIHNVHFEAYGAMFLGQPEVALAASEELMRMLPDEVVRFMPELFESFYGKKIHVMIRFGQWQAILDEPFPEDRTLYCYTTAAMHQARAIAFANLGRNEDAVRECELAVTARKAVPEEWLVFNNTCEDVLLIGEAMMDGEVSYKAGRIEEGLAHLRRSVELDDSLIYDEPWGWMQPTRHALGALLMDAGQYEEAEAVYRADLGLDKTLPRACQHPRNVWSLHGLHECLVRRGERVEASHIRLQLDQAAARATVPIRASCYCRKAAAA